MRSILYLTIFILILGGCKKNDPFPYYEHTFSFEERKKSIYITPDMDHIHVKGKVGRLYLMSDCQTLVQTLKIIPELTTATPSQYHLPDSLLLHFTEENARDSLKIDIYPDKIESPVSIAFSPQNIVIGRNYSLYIDTTIITLIPLTTTPPTCNNQ